MKTYCVYAHRKASTGEVFYIGKGGPQRAASKVGRSTRWHRTVAKHGLQIEIIKSDMPEPCAFTLEKALIHSIGRDRLCNLTDGGEGTSGRVASEAQRRKCSASNKGTKPAQASIDGSRIRNSRPVGTRCGLIFPSITAAAKVVSPHNWRAGKAGVCAAAQGRFSQAYGYEWGYIVNGDPQFLFVPKPKKIDRRPWKWRAVQNQDGLKFDSATDAVNWLRSIGYLKANTGAICRSAKFGVPMYGMVWSYV